MSRVIPVGERDTAFGFVNWSATCGPTRGRGHDRRKTSETDVTNTTFLTRVVLKNYKSIAACDVRLQPLVFLVGPNGSGKSNFLDALRLLNESLNTSLDHALRDRGGINEVRRRSGGHPTHFSVLLEFQLADGTIGTYSFRVGSREQGGYEVQSEECRIRPPRALATDIHYQVRDGQVVQTSLKIAPATAKDRLYLVNVSGLPEFRPVYDALSHMAFYNLNPDRIRDLQAPDAGEVLQRDGSNLASVLGHLQQHSATVKNRVEEFLAAVVPGVVGVEAKQVGPKETLEFRQHVGVNQPPWRFFAANMSDGTLRALGVLVALLQTSNGAPNRVPLVAIEEPEIALHPAAAGVLRDCLRAASQTTQVIVTSHSPDLLDDREIPDNQILPVVSEQGVTKIAPVDEAGRTAIREHLYTPGELLRLNQLTPDPEAVAVADRYQPSLFDEVLH
ncbi:MAG: AAA family ATPase [Planctomycetes bacterium]|nr:AAA family ATPase [Planctomycetota bacterium]